MLQRRKRKGVVVESTGIGLVCVKDRKGWRKKEQIDLKRDINVLKRQRTR